MTKCVRCGAEISERHVDEWVAMINGFPTVHCPDGKFHSSPKEVTS